MSQPIATVLWAVAFVVALGSSSLFVVRHDLATQRAARRRTRARLTAPGLAPRSTSPRVTT